MIVWTFHQIMQLQKQFYHWELSTCPPLPLLPNLLGSMGFPLLPCLDWEFFHKIFFRHIVFLLHSLNSISHFISTRFMSCYIFYFITNTINCCSISISLFSLLSSRLSFLCVLPFQLLCSPDLPDFCNLFLFCFTLTLSILPLLSLLPCCHQYLTHFWQ